MLSYSAREPSEFFLAIGRRRQTLFSEHLIMKKVLILGCGYVGRAFALSAKAKGHRVLAVTRNETAADQLREDGVEVFLGRVHEAGWHGFAGGGVDWALNCVSSADSTLDGYRTSYVDGNRFFSLWMETSGFSGSAIYTSSVSVYPDRGGDWVQELGSRGDSERSRLMMESEAVFFSSSQHVSKTILRLGGIYGPGRSFLLDRIRSANGPLPGYGDYYLNLIRLEDIVSGIEAVFESDLSAIELFNLVDDEPLVKSDLVDVLATQMGVAKPVFDESIGEEGSTRRTEGGRPANRRVSNRVIKEALGWSPKYRNALHGMGGLISS